METQNYHCFMTESMRDILNRVAAGELSPEEAQVLLGQAEAPEAASTSEPEAPAPDLVPLPVARIMIRATGVRLSVVGDPTVATAVADGSHRVTHEGETLVINSDLSQGNTASYTTDAPRSAFMNWLSTVNRAGSNLRVRVNPNLPLEILNIAGPLELAGTAAPLAIGVEAGSARLSAGSGPLNLSVAAGSADVDWLFTGESSVVTELGSAKVTVAPGSDAVVTADSSLGSAQIHTDGGILKASSAAGPQSVTVGAGAGKLTVTAKLGSADVRIG